MKRACIMLAGLACIMASTLQPALAADVMQGTVALGGGFNASATFLDTDDGYPGDMGEERILAGSLRLGYLFADNFEFGFRLMAEARKGEDQTGSYESTDFVFGPMVRVHLPLSNEINALLGTGMGYGFFDRDYEAAGAKDVDADGWMIMVEGGFEYFFSDAVALEFVVELGQRELEQDNQDYDRTFIRPVLGLSVYF